MESTAMHAITAPRRPSLPRSILSCVAFVAMGLVLAGCKGKVTTDLTSDQPADLGIQQVVAKVQGLEFIKDDDSTQTLEFSTEEPMDLIRLLNGNVSRLFTEEELPAGTYVGVRLLLDVDDDDAYVLDATNTKQTMTIVDGDYAPISFTIKDSSTSTQKTQAFTLTLDLRQSLSVDDSKDYELKPVLRTVVTEDAGVLQGKVTASCAANLLAAVYVFQGEDETPDDIDSQDAEPFATVPVFYNTATATATYLVRDLPAADYTVAVACKGDDDSPTADDDVDFHDGVNIEIQETKTTTRDLL